MRPFVFINSAMSADGKIATIKRKQTRISGTGDFQRVDELRAGADAVMVGIGTVLSDNPSLTVKSEERRKQRVGRGLEENPDRVVVDSKARMPLDADIFKKGTGKRIVAVSASAPVDRLELLRRKAEIIVAGNTEVDLVLLMAKLKKRGINRLMVEGGATLNFGLISQGLIDEIYTFIGNMIIGGSDAPTLVDGAGFEKPIQLTLVSAEKMDDGLLVKWQVQKREEFCKSSADFIDLT